MTDDEVTESFKNRASEGDRMSESDVDCLIRRISQLEASVVLHKAAISTLEARDALMLGVRNDLQAKVTELERSRDCWKEDAERFCRNESYYRGLVVKIGEMFGTPAYTSDDGSVQQDVLCAKVPELVAAQQVKLHALKSLLLEWMDHDVQDSRALEIVYAVRKWCES